MYQIIDFHLQVVLLQIAIPSRGDVAEYQNLQNQVFELVGRINGKFSN
jgi:trehalose-6-phosphate synthase